MKSIDGDEIIKLIGLSSTNPVLDNYFSDYHIYDKPFLPSEDEGYDEDSDEDPYEAIKRSSASTICEAERYSLVFVYDDKEEYQLLHPSNTEQGDFFLRIIVFYAEDIQDFIGFNGILPFGLNFDFSRQDVQLATGTSPLFSREIEGHSVDRHYINGFLVDISYDEKKMTIIHVKRPHYYDLKMLGQDINIVTAKPTADINTLLELFGEDIFSDKLKFLQPYLPEDIDIDNECFDEVIDLLHEKGETFYLHCANKTKKGSANILRAFYFYCVNKIKKKKLKKNHANILLAGVHVSRRGYRNSKGFHGVIPYGIEYFDTPEQVIIKMGNEPDEVCLASQTILLIWSKPLCTVQVLCSLIDYQVLSVSFLGDFMDDEAL